MKSKFALLTTQLSIVASGVACAATVFAMRYANVRADGGALIELCGTLAVIWATKFAADNLQHLRAVEEDRQRPLIVPEWIDATGALQSMYDLKLRNHGIVVALNVEAEVLRRLPGEQPRTIHRVRTTTTTFTPGELYATNFNRPRLALDPGSLIIRLQYSSPSGECITNEWETPYEDAEFMVAKQRLVT